MKPYMDGAVCVRTAARRLRIRAAFIRGELAEIHRLYGETDTPPARLPPCPRCGGSTRVLFRGTWWCERCDARGPIAEGAR